MRIISTREALASLREALKIIKSKVSNEKLRSIRKSIFDKADSLKDNPEMGQVEEYLEQD
jgi:plasmid stabilization system protein ParE